MSELFKDVSDIDRAKKFLLGLTQEEREFLKKQAQDRGVHMAVLIRRAIRVALIDKPDLFQLFQS